MLLEADNSAESNYTVNNISGLNYDVTVSGPLAKT